MFDHFHYVPILKAKDGEYRALQDLAGEAKARLTPLLEIPPIPWDYEADRAAKSIDEHIQRVAERISSCWQGSRPVFLDLESVEGAGNTGDGRHPLARVFDDARARSVPAVPVTGIGRAREYQAAVLQAMQRDGRGVCIRLEGEDFEGNVGEQLDGLLRSLETRPSDVDLVIDFAEVSAGPAQALTIAAREIVRSLPWVTGWRTLTFAGSAFPQSLTGLGAQQISLVPRVEWSIWQSLRASNPPLPRIPTFSDYTSAHPELIEMDPRIMQRSVAIRYTATETWLVVKGRSVRRFGAEQSRALCQALIARPEYSGPAFSWGDNYINDCAAGNNGPGNATTWRRVATNHHLTFVTRQIATLAGS